MVPVDLSGLDIDDTDAMVESLGPKGAAEAFVKAETRFEENKKDMPEDAVPMPMTAEEWQKLAAEDLDEGEESELEGSEEEDDGEDEDDDEEDEGEPAAKKAKTS